MTTAATVAARLSLSHPTRYAAAVLHYLRPLGCDGATRGQICHALAIGAASAQAALAGLAAEGVVVDVSRSGRVVWRVAQ